MDIEKRRELLKKHREQFLKDVELYKKHISSWGDEELRSKLFKLKEQWKNEQEGPHPPPVLCFTYRCLKSVREEIQRREAGVKMSLEQFKPKSAKDVRKRKSGLKCEVDYQTVEQLKNKGYDDMNEIFRFAAKTLKKSARAVKGGYYYELHRRRLKKLDS